MHYIIKILIFPAILEFKNARYEGFQKDYFQLNHDRIFFLRGCVSIRDQMAYFLSVKNITL